MCRVLNKHHAGVPAGAAISAADRSGAIRSGSAPMAIATPSSRNMGAGSQISTISCAPSTSCADAISSASESGRIFTDTGRTVFAAGFVTAIGSLLESVQSDPS
jgi:hypothetical protein